MITNFKIIDEFGHEFVDRITAGIHAQWDYNEKFYSISVKDPTKQLIVACVTPSREEIVVVYYGSEEFKAPNNAAVFNAEGSLRHQIYMPNLISKEYESYRLNSSLNIGSRHFLQPNITLQGTVTIWIEFGKDSFEIRLLNLKTGEVGELLGVSRL